MPDRTRLSASTHAIYELRPDLLLVAKPAGHVEPSHAHDVAQRLTVVSGALVVRCGGQETVLTSGSPAVDVAAGCEHATEARADTWLLVERGRADGCDAAR